MDRRTSILRILKVVFEPIFRAAGLRKSSLQLSLADARSIVIVNANPGLGDLVVMTAFVREFRRALPNAFITCVVVDRFESFLEHCPYIDELFIVPWPARITAQWVFKCNERLNKLRAKRKFEVAICLPSNNCEVLSYLTGAVQRLGFSKGEPWSDQFLTSHFPAPPLSHEVDKLLYLLKQLGVEAKSDKLEVWLGDEDERFAEETFLNGNLNSRLVVALAPGASSFDKQWPAERFSEISEWLVKRMRASIVVVGGKPDAAWGDELVSALGSSVLNLSGKTTIRQAAAVLKRCNLYVGNDTGPKHLAAAGGTKVVEISCVPVSAEALYWTGPELWHAWGVDHRVVRPGKKHVNGDVPCIEAVSVAMVKAAILEIIGARWPTDLDRNSSESSFSSVLAGTSGPSDPSELVSAEGAQSREAER
jgi:ADP-heptose:LPS heptosyltransferase